MTTPRWTAAQQAAIDHLGGDLLISAAAGSGKTATLAERCARLVAGGHCGVDALLVLTFTDAAANEMRSRIALALASTESSANAPLFGAAQKRFVQQAALVQRAAISTLHSFCARILRQYFHDLNIDPAFELIAPEEAGMLRQEILSEVIARWHIGAQTKEPFATHFADFFEAYAQSRDSALSDLIERLYAMLASTADPARWKRDARCRFDAAGIELTLDSIARTTLAGRLQELFDQGTRAHDVLTDRAITGPLLTNVQTLLSITDSAVRVLQAEGFAAWGKLPGMLPDEWETIRTPKEGPDDFGALKKTCWESCRDVYRKILEGFFIADAATMRADLHNMVPHIDTLLALVEDFDRTFTAAKRDQNRLDFNDLERLALSLLTSESSLARVELRERFDYILVDEFQDINPLQAALLDAVRSDTKHAGTGNLFVVGDVKQSIYGFRLAEPRLFIERERRARTVPNAFIALANNFRTQPALLTIMNALLERLLTPTVAEVDYRQGHALQGPEISRPLPSEPGLLTGEPLEILLVTTRDESGDAESSDASADADSAEAPAQKENLSATDAEARLVAQRIKAIMTENRRVVERDGTTRALHYKDIAILLRAMADRALLFARALAAEGIPVHADLSTGYFDAPEVQQVLAMLAVLDNPQQDIPLASALVGPFGSLTFDDLTQIRLAYDRQKFSFFAAAHAYVENAAAADPVLAAKLRALFETYARWRVWTRTRPLHEALGEIYAESRIIPYTSALEAGIQRVANLQMLHQRALQFSGFRKQGLHRFLRFIDRLRERETDFGEAPVLSEASDVVRILSVHKSKGLEFPVVFFSGLGNLLNLGRDSVSPLSIHRDLHLSPKVADVDRNIFYHSAASLAAKELHRSSDRAEELRLLYVAITRARDQLILTGQIASADALGKIRDTWTGFPDDLPKDVLLNARRFIDWLLPALASSNLRIQWPAEFASGSPIAQPQVVVSLREMSSLLQALSPPPAALEEATIQKLLAGEPIDAVDDSAVSDLLALRLTARYAFDPYTQQAAVVTVSELKKHLDSLDPESPVDAQISAPIIRASSAPTLSSDQARARGIATHRVLELLDFRALAAGASVDQQISRMIVDGALLDADAPLVDRAALNWFLSTPLAARLLEAACGKSSLELQREIPFTWISPSLPLTSTDPEDWPTVRGIIDALLIHRDQRTAEIFDYKTDALHAWQTRVPEYRRQMRYYLRAAADILGFPVTRASLIFLTARRIETVLLSEIE